MKRMTLVVLFFLLSLSPQVFSLNYDDDAFFIPADVKVLVDKTFSVYAKDRAEAAFKLSRMGGKAYKSVPFLMRLLDDNLPVWCRYNGYGEWTTPGREAAKALAEIGNPSLKYIFPLLENSHPYISMNTHMEKNLVFSLHEITGMEFESGLTKWIEWMKTQRIYE